MNNTPAKMASQAWQAAKHTKLSHSKNDKPSQKQRLGMYRVDLTL